MKTMKWLAGMIMTVIFLTGCARTAYVQKDNAVDFSKIKTYAWVDAVDTKGSKKKTTKLNDLTDRKIRESISANLEQNGWKESSRNPDVLLIYDVVIERENRNVSTPVYSQPLTRWFFNPRARRWVPMYYPSQFMGYDNNTQTVKAGTLTLTMMDAATDKTIWQGWTTSDVYGKQMSDKEIDGNVKAIVKKLDKQS